MKSRKIRMASLMLAGVMTLGLFAGCSKDASQSSTSGGNKDSIVIATMSETPSLSPTDHNAVAGSYMNILTYNTLFRGDMDLKPVPELVDTYENTSDTEWVFHLRQGVKFHDGSEMTADDVVASIEYAKTCPEVNLYNGSVEKIEKVDDYTVKITTPGSSAILLNDLCHHGNAIVPKKLLDEGHDFATDPVGSGPYKFVSWKRGDSLEFEAFEDYFDKDHMPSIKHMTWKIIPEGSSRTIALEAGEVDFVVEVEAMDAERIESNSDLTLLQHDSTNHMWMMLNNEKPGLSNVDVRRAINSVVNKENIVTVALNGMGVASYSQTPSNLEGATEEKSEKYDVEQAKKYMEQSGVDPSTIQLSIICSNDQKKRAAEVIQSDVATLGIDATIESMDLATYLSTTAEGNYTAAIGNYSASNMLSYLTGVYHSKSIGASNKTRLNNPEVDALIDQACATIDEAEREEVLRQCNTLINELCPQVPLFQDVYLRAYNANLEGVEINAAGFLYFNDVKWKE